MNQNTQLPVATEQEAQKTVKMMYEGKVLTKYVPKGQSPKLYIDLIKSQVMKPDKAGKPRSDSDLLLFLYVAKRTGLDPLTKQIYAVFRWDSRQGKEVMAIQAGIDGFRLVAQRTGAYAGQDDAVMTPEDESTKYPTKAQVTVYKNVNGQRVAFSASARWSEYAPTGKDGKVEFMWDKMPYTMLAKCAEALALRKGFPNELSGVYAEEEMRQIMPTETQQIANLPAPAKAQPQDQITVEHGAPSDESAMPQKVTPENIDQFNEKLMGDDSPDEKTVAKPIQQPATEPNVGAMRAKLQKPTISEMQDKLRAMGKETAEKGILDEGRGLDNTSKEEIKQEVLLPESQSAENK